MTTTTTTTTTSTTTTTTATTATTHAHLPSAAKLRARPLLIFLTKPEAAQHARDARVGIVPARQLKLELRRLKPPEELVRRSAAAALATAAAVCVCRLL